MAVANSSNSPAVADVAGAYVAPGGTPGVAEDGGLNDIGAIGVQGFEENVMSFVEQMENDSSDEGSPPEAPSDVVERPAAGEPAVVEPVLVPAAKTPVAKPAVEPAPAVAPAPVVTPQAPAAVTPGATAPQAGQEQVPGQAPADAPAGQPAAPAEGEGPPVDPFALAAETIRQNEAVFIEKLANDVYTIDQEQFNEVLGGNPKSLGVLCARVHANAVSSCMRTVAQTLPVYLDGMLRVRDQNREREDRFWAANPHLNKAQHKQHLRPIVQAARQLNPTADEATLHRLVGHMAAASFQIPLGQAPAQPSAPRVNTPGPVVRTVSPAFQPAGVNGVTTGPGAQAAPGSDNIFSRMTDILQADDQGLFDQ